MAKIQFRQFFVSLAALTVGIGAFTLSATSAQADCPTQYGGGQYGSTDCPPQDLTVNKKVRMPGGTDFVENLNENDAKYSPDNEVIFSLAVTNSGNQTFEDVAVKDVLPEHITTARVADELKGSYNASNRELTFVLKDLKANETRLVDVTAKLAASGYPSTTSVTCVNNFVEVSSEDRKDDDTAKFCVQTNVLGKTTLPQAGLEDYLPLMPFIAIGITGVWLMTKKRAV